MPAYYTVVSRFNRFRTKQNPRSFFVSTEYRPMHRPILDRRVTDILPTHWRCYRDRLSVDLSTESDPMIGRYIAYIAADARSTLARYSTDNRPILGGYIDRDIDRQSTDISTVTIDRGPL